MTKKRASDDITTSQTSTEAVDLPPSSAERLLGKAPLSESGEPVVLLRLRKLPAPELAAAWTLEEGDVRPDRPVIVGPVALKDARRYVVEQKLAASTEVLSSFDRWRGLRATFPDLAEVGFPGEMTQTSTETSTATLGSNLSFDDEIGPTTSVTRSLDDLTKTPPNSEFLEGKSIEDDEPTPGPSGGPGDSAAELAAGRETPIEGDDGGTGATLATERPRSPAAPLGARLKPAAPSLRPEASDSRLPVAAARPAPSGLVIAIAVAALVLAGFVVFKSRQSKKAAGIASGPLTAALEARVREEAAARAWPEALRPRSEESLYESDSPMLRRIRPILRAYERGVTSLSSADETTLRQVADPATADWEARRIASNQLAVFLLARLETDAAQEILNPILEASPEDFASLTNRALIRLAESELKDAREAAAGAVTNCGAQGLCWIAYSIQGLVESAEGSGVGVDRAFQTALSKTSNNPFAYGLYLHSMLRLEARPQRGQLSRLMRQALASDPDRLIDSPIPAPIAGHILLGQALEGLKEAGDLPQARITTGQKAYLRWLEGRFRSNPLVEPQSQVRDLLAAETQPLSRVLYAYMLKRQKRYDLALSTLAEVLTNLDGEIGTASSWPWTLTGDLHFETANIDAAILHYQQALSRNPRDVAALHGLSMIFRGKNDVIASEARLAEALFLDRLFRPSLLRVTRFEWQGSSGRE